MHRILILDRDQPSRAQLVEALHRTANTETVLVADDTQLIAMLKFGIWAAVFADADLLDSGAANLIAATRGAIVRPILVIASNERADDFDPDMVTLIIRKPYDVQTLTGILLSAIPARPPAADPKADTTTIC